MWVQLIMFFVFIRGVMNNMSPFLSYLITFTQESFLYPLRIHLSAKQKKVAVIALAIFSFVAACSFSVSFLF